MWYDDYHAFDSFRAEYWQAHRKAPYVSPPTRDVWRDRDCDEQHDVHAMTFVTLTHHQG
jgi:hypothetical protein